MVAFLEKPTKSDGFKEIFDFLNAHPIKYALTVNPIVYTLCIQQFWATAKAKTINGEEQLQALGDRKKVIITESTIRSDLRLEDVEGTECLPNATIFEELTRMGFVQVFLDKQVGDMSIHDEIYVSPSHTKKVFVNMKWVGKGFFGNITPLFPTMMVQAQEELGEDEAVNEEMNDSLERAAATATSLDAEKDSGNINKTQSKATPNEPSSRGTSLGGGPRRQDTMGDTITQTRVLALETTKTNQALEIKSLKRRVKRLEKRQRSRTHKLKWLYKGRKIHDINADQDITLKNVHGADMFGVQDLKGDEVIANAATITVGDTTTTTEVEVTLAQELVDIKTSKPKAKGIGKDKGKTIMVEEPMKSKNKVQIMLDKEATKKLQAQFDEEARDKVETDYELAQRLQQEEQEELTIEKKAILFQQLLEKRRKNFAAKREEEKRNRPPTKAQQRSFMCTYLKNMEGWNLKNLKNKSFTNIQELFEKAMKRVNTFVDYRAELVEKSIKTSEAETVQESSTKREEEEIVQESSTKRAGDELEQENKKKQKMDDD
ncbi:hypothetical protein Tco_1437382 [Tanacetum coccineum]